MRSIAGLWRILSPSQRASAIGLVGLMIVTMLLEMVGLGIVIPALSLMASDAPIEPPPPAAALLNWLGNPSRGVLLLWGLLALLGLYGFKAAFLLFSAWRQSVFTREVHCDLSERLFAIYLWQPWTFHLQRNSSLLLRNIGDIAQVTNLLGLLLGALSELIVMTGVIALLIWYEPVGAITVACVSAIATVLLEKVTASRLERWGREVQRHAGQASKHLVEGLHAAKDIKVRGCEATFIEQYAHHNTCRGTFQARQTMTAYLPRLWFELVAVTSLCALTAVLTWQGKPTQEMIPALGLFAAAAFRMLPSVNKLALAAQNAGYLTAVVDTVASELALPGPSTAGAGPGGVSFRRAIELDGVTFRYPAAALPALADVRLTIPYGASVGLIGGSGAGKSTLVDIVLGLLDPTAGRVLVDGRDIHGQLRAWQRRVGYVPQAIYLSDDTIRRNVAFGLREDEIDDDAVARALASAQLDAFVRSLPDGTATVVGDRGVRLSGGQRQRIGIARALYHDPDLLVLDEATSALDTDTERGVMDAIESLHGAKTLLIVAHRLTTVNRCDIIYKLDAGRVLQSGTFTEVVVG